MWIFDFTCFVQKFREFVFQKRGVRMVGFSNVGLSMKLKKVKQKEQKNPFVTKVETREKRFHFLFPEVRKKASNFNYFASFHQLYCTTFIFLGNLTRTLINQVWKINSILADASQWCFVYVAAASEIFWNAIRHSKCQVGACHLIHQLLLKNE